MPGWYILSANISMGVRDSIKSDCKDEVGIWSNVDTQMFYYLKPKDTVEIFRPDIFLNIQ